MHLHPRWQQQVLGLMRYAFPALQIIVTTHSPHVLSTVEISSDEGHARRKLQVRFDPLLGTSSRIAEGVKLQTRSEAALDPFRVPMRTARSAPTVSAK